MNIQPDAISNISDDQELAKALAGVNGGFEETPIEEPEPEETPEQTPEEINPLPINPSPIQPQALPTNPVPQRDELEQVKMEAINELRPLVDKLILPPDEKFDVYLLLIRCTDDRTLVAPAHEVAKLIEDDTRRATALLDIIKEIEYLESKPLPEESTTTEEPASTETPVEDVSAAEAVLNAPMPPAPEAPAAPSQPAPAQAG